jgi:hypothetical protein
MITTASCKNFIADFIKENPSIVNSIYGEYANKIPDLINHATNPSKWKRMYKCKPSNGNYEFDEYTIYSKTNNYSRMGYDVLPTRPASEFVSERGFYLDPETYDTGVAFVVIEDKNGNLFLGDYIGD